MKRISLVLIMLLLLTVTAAAESRKVVDQAGKLVWMEFDDELPAEAQTAFSSVLRAGDRVLSGALHGTRQQQEAILAVEREGKVLLMGAVLASGENTWKAAIETDSFFAPGTELDIKAEPTYSPYGNELDDKLRIACGEERYGLSLYANGSIKIEFYDRLEADGSWFNILLGFGTMACYRYVNDAREELCIARGVIPGRFAAWTHATFPKTAEQVQDAGRAHALELAWDEAFVSGGNFREKPTGSSKSWGQYCAKVKVLGSEPGTQEPWIHVQLGHLTGWVSDNYVLNEQEDFTRFYSAISALTTVGRVRQDAAICNRPEEEAFAVIPEGTMMHVLEEKDGWAHVIVPRSEITWQTDWDGTYGFVRADDVVMGVSVADVKWK